MKKKFSFLQLPWFALALLFFSNKITAQFPEFDYDLYVFDTKEGTTKRLTTLSNTGEWNASWSNNGKKIAHDHTIPFGAQSIYITDVQTGASTLLAGAETGNDPAWSPDGAKIAFDDFGNIFMLPAGGGVRSFFRFGAHHASWNQDGTKIAFDDNYGYIGTKDVNTGIETIVTYYGNRPTWSPNGQYIAFDGWSGGVWVVKVDISGNPIGLPWQVTTTGFAPTFKKNSKEIVYIDFPGGDPDLYSIPITGGTPTRVCGRVGDFNHGDYDPSYSNDGRFIVWSSYTDVVFTNRVSISTQENTNDRFDAVLYPNPVRGTSALRVAGNTKNIDVTISNINGQILWQSRFSNQTQIPLPSDKLSAGVYIISIKTDSEKRTLKLVRE